MTNNETEGMWERPRYPNPGHCFVCGKQFHGQSHLCHEHRDFMLPRKEFVNLIPGDVNPLSAQEGLDYWEFFEYDVMLSATMCLRVEAHEDQDVKELAMDNVKWGDWDDIEVVYVERGRSLGWRDADGKEYLSDPESLMRSFAGDVFRDIRPRPHKDQRRLDQW